MTLAEDLDLTDHDPHRPSGKHAVDRRWPVGVGVARLVARNHTKENPHPFWPASPRRGRWAE